MQPTYSNSCSAESVDTSIGSCSECIGGFDSHPSGESCDLSYAARNSFNCSQFTNCAYRAYRQCSNKSSLANCSDTRQFTCSKCSSNFSRNSNKLNHTYSTDQSVYQMDYSKQRPKQLVVNNHRTHLPERSIPVYCVNNVNNRFILIVCLLICSLANCQRTYVQLTFESEENLPVNSLIGQIRVPDTHHNYTQPPYLILPVNGQQKGICNPNADLTIDQHTGDIRNAVHLDREKCSLYKFLAISMKGISFQITIHVKNQNDNRPFYAVPSINIQLPENLKPNEIRRNLASAIDLDDGQFGLQDYRIKSGNVNNTFKLYTHRENDGILYVDLQVNRELDREEISNYKLIIEALDGGTPPLTAELEVNIEVVDINDNKPSFSKSVYEVKLQQNATIGSRLLQVQATDKDVNSNGQISYSLQESPNTLKLLNNKNVPISRLFEIDNQGWITLVNSALNIPKSLTTYELIVIARDAGDIPLENSVLVIVSIQRSTNNYFSPRINVLLLNENNRPELNESAKVGEIVARIMISDEVSEQSVYKLRLDKNESSVINSFKVREIDQNTYLLIVNSKLDREHEESVHLKLTAYQATNPMLNTSQLLTFLIKDQNDNAPYFDERVIFTKLNQYSQVNTLVHQFKALDDDLPSTNHFTYTLDESRSQSFEWFELNRSTGELRVKRSMYCDKNKSPLIVVTVNDGLNEGESTSLVIELQSNNDYVPVFEQTFYNVTVDESASLGFCFLTLVANDLDCGLNSTINYSLMATNRADLPWTNSLSAFYLNETTGELCIATKLNYEQRHFYELIVVASNPPEQPKLNSTRENWILNSTSIVHIYVEDANSHEPEFITTRYRVNIHENIIPLMSNGLPAPILVIKAHDRDASPNFNTILYSIVSGNDDSGFEIDEQTGKLFLLKPLSSIDSHRELKVSAEDLGGLKSQTLAIVNVYVLNSGLQQEYLHFTSTLYNFNLVENALPNIKIGRLSVQATTSPFHHADQVNHVNMYNQTSSQSSSMLNNHLLEYTIYSGNDRQYFQIDSNSGDLTVSKNSSQLINSILDFERTPNLLINVQCRLANANNEFIYTAYSQVNVSLINLNDNSAEFYNDVSVVSLKEDLIRSTTTRSAFIFAVKAVDTDSGLFGRVRYHFRALVQDQLETTDQSGPFYMNKSTGEIFILNAELDYEQQATYDLNVLSVDGGGRTNEMQIKVNLIDLSDNSPYFVDEKGQAIQHLNLSVFENMVPNEVLYRFATSDQDVNDRTFFYSIANEKQLLVNGSWVESCQSFAFNELTNGELKVNRTLDAEQVLAYELLIEVRDVGNNRGQLALAINILDINDNVPQFEKYEYRFQLSEDSVIGSRIGQIFAHDLDRGRNGTVQYDLIKNLENTFELDSKTGELFLTKKLDRECEKERYVLKVQVSDLGQVRLVNDQLATIIIDVIDVNNHKPAFLEPHQSISSFIKQQCSKTVQKSVKKIEQFKLPTNSQVSTIVTRIRAYDMDDQENGTIHYKIKHVQQVYQETQIVDLTNDLFDISSDGLITTRQLFANKNQLFRLAIEIEDSRGLKADHLKLIEILLSSTNNSTNEKVKNLRSDFEYIEIESLRVGQSIGPVVDLNKQFKLSEQIKRRLCDEYYLNSALFEDQAFTLNISGTKINLVSLTDNLETPLKLILYSNDDCSLAIASSSALQTNGLHKVLAFEIELKARQVKDRPFDCLRNQFKNSEFGDELVQINLDFSQETIYEKSIDLYDFKHCSTIQPNQQFKLNSLDDLRIRGKSQLKINSDLVLQLSLDDDHLLYDRELLINIEALSNVLSGSVTDSILMNFVFNKRADLNLNSLKVIDDRSVLEFDENCCSSGEIIHQIRLNSDLSESHKLNYSINNQTEFEIFKIDNNGLISLLKPFDYENQSTYDLNVRIEIDEPLNKLEHLIRIKINDVNDETPSIQQNLEIEFPENTRVGTLLFKIKATDRDLIDANNLTYLISDGYQHKKTFELNSRTGELRLRSSLDRERLTSYQIPIIVFDCDYEHYVRTHLNLKIHDVNDNVPQFKQSESIVIIPENVPIRTPVYTFIASDEDETSQLNYELMNCENCPFELNSKTGELITKSEIDFEITQSYNLTCSVSDGQHSSTCSLIVRIKNLNDNRPVLFANEQLHEIDLDKITPNDKLFYELTTLQATDLDKDSKLYYSINLDTNDSLYFTMNSTTGLLAINQAALNRLLRSKLNNKSITVQLTIQVMDVTDYNVQNATGRIRIRFSGTNYLDALRGELEEMRRTRIKFIQYPIVIELNEQFLNKKLIHYLVNGEQMNDVRFELINQTSDFREQFSLSRTGEFSLKSMLKNRNYECVVIARSEQFGETLNLIQFTRMPMIHSPMQLRKFSFELNLKTNLPLGHRLIQLDERVNIYLKDDHHFRVIYSSVNDDWFSLDSKTGLLRTAIKFDYEKHPSKIELIVLANLPDSYTNLLLFNVSINLINADNRLIFNHPIIYTTINESLPKDTFVCKLSAIDLDGLNQTTYHIVEGNRDNAFKIVNNSLYTNVVLDREIREKYTLFIFANEAHSILKMKSNTLNYLIVEVMVIDLNDNVPYLASNQEMLINDNSASQLVGTINSNDVDLYPLMLTYQMVNDSNYEANQQLFDLNRFTGEIRLKSKLKFNDSLADDSPLREFHFSAVASDSIHQAETRIRLNLRRNTIYQQVPTFSEEIYYVEMRDCLKCALVQVKCNLPIRRSNSAKIKIQYKLIGKASRYFNVDPNDGYVYNNQTLPTNESTGRLFRLVVQSYYAFENGRPINNLRATSTLLIVVKSGDSMQTDTLSAKHTIELDRYEYGSVIYRLPERSNVRYALESDMFALKNRNQIIILKKPKRVESTLKIKQLQQNTITTFYELNIRFAFHHKNDKNQLFKRRLFNIQLNENTTIGQQIVDLRMNESYLFKIHKANNHFKLEHTGVLYLAQRLNCKLADHYNLIIIASNGLKSDFAVVRIQVLPPLHHLTLPILALDHYQATINENIPIGTRIIKIMDRNSLSTLEGFRFVLTKDSKNSSPVDSKRLFQFDTQTGYLISTSPIDYESLVDDVLDYKLGLQFIDSNSYSKSLHNGTSALINLSNEKSKLLNPSSIRIKVKGEDEFYPKFERSLYDFKVEIQPNESNRLIGEIHAVDEDRGIDGEVIYSINSTVPSWARELFELDAKTGILTFDFRGTNAMINSWLQSSNAYVSMIVIANSPKTNSLSAMTMVDINIQTNKQPGNELRSAYKVNQLIGKNYESENELKSTSPATKQSNHVRTVSEMNGQRKLITGNQVYAIVIALLVILLVLILFSVVLLFRICNFNRKDTTSSNNSIYNSKSQSDYDPNSQLTKSMSCLIGHQNSSDSTIIAQQLKQADFMINMQRNSIIYQEQHTNGAYLNTSLIKPTDTLSNCNTSITILHSHENSETKSTSEQADSIHREHAAKRLSGHSLHAHSNAIKNRPLPANPPDIVNSYQEAKYYDEVREHAYYSNYKELENSFNHNYEAISPAYDEQVEFFQNSWSPAYHPVAEILRDANVINSIAKSNAKSFVTDSKHRSAVKTATLANMNKLA